MDAKATTIIIVEGECERGRQTERCTEGATESPAFFAANIPSDIRSSAVVMEIDDVKQNSLKRKAIEMRVCKESTTTQSHSEFMEPNSAPTAREVEAFWGDSGEEYG